jgi:CubicO group peptidase (beta-lactamase class C family)
MNSDSARVIGRRRLLGWGGLAAGVAAGAPLVGARLANADPASADAAIPPDTLPGGAYDRYLAGLAAEGRFSGVVLLSHRGRTVLSRSYGMADREKGIRNHQGIAVSLSSAAKPFCAVAVLQLVQQGRVKLTDTVGTYLAGFPKEIAEQVTIHHMLGDTSGLVTPEQDLQRVFHSREEVHEYHERWTRQATLVAAPGTGGDGHSGANFAIPAQIVEAVTGMTYWDYVQEHIFRRAGMTGSAFYTRPQWLTDEHIAHSYMLQSDGTLVDAVRNLDKGSQDPYQPGKNPGRSFIDYDGFATAPDLVRFAHALHDGTVLDRPYGEVLTAAKVPHGGQSEGGRSASAETSYGAYLMAVAIVNGQWVFGRAGVNPGSAASWNIYPHSDWVGVVLTNTDGVPLQEILQREVNAVTGQR